MIDLPLAFRERMKTFLGAEYDEFLNCFANPGYRGLRVNPLKCSVDILKTVLPFSLEASPFSPYGYYIPNDVERIGTHPLHHAGAFYVQEPSASSAVTVLDPKPGDRVLDLCAAPGGKSTQIAGCLKGQGLLWSNEFVKNRAAILLSNIERLGVANAVVSSCHPEQLCSQLTGYFDKVLVDAPCSGEGMFLHDPGAVAAWSAEHVLSCAVRQSSILDSAAAAVAPNGILVYSTCTYAEEENEGVITAFLERHPEFTLMDCGVQFGRASHRLPQTRRILPMDGGDGHFIAKLQKTDGPIYNGPWLLPAKKRSAEQKLGEELLQDLSGASDQYLTQNGEYLYLMPNHLPDPQRLHILRAGVLFGEVKKNRIAPCHHYFMSVKPSQLQQVVALESSQETISNFLRGEEIPVPKEFRGFAGVSVDGVMVGFGKCSGGTMKNHYPKGLRNLR